MTSFLQKHSKIYYFIDFNQTTGICLGLQIAVIEFARNVLKWENANSVEVDPETPHPVVSRTFF